MRLKARDPRSKHIELDTPITGHGSAVSAGQVVSVEQLLDEVWPSSRWRRKAAIASQRGKPAPALMAAAPLFQT